MELGLVAKKIFFEVQGVLALCKFHYGFQNVPYIFVGIFVISPIFDPYTNKHLAQHRFYVVENYTF